MTSIPVRPAHVRDLGTAEEIAAVLAALDVALHAARTSSEPALSGYERWRRTRQKALLSR